MPASAAGSDVSARPRKPSLKKKLVASGSLTVLLACMDTTPEARQRAVAAKARRGPVRLVIDTNVLVSALLTPARLPAATLDALLRRRDVVLYDARILDEYRAVLGRPKFASIPRERADALVTSLISIGHDVGMVAAWSGALVDATDRIFVEVAAAGDADVLLTGNAKHFPQDTGFAVMGPTALLGLIDGR